MRKQIKTKNNLSFIRTDESDPSFRIDIYPFLVSYKVRRELGIAISSTPEYIWFLIYDGENLIAFAVLEPGETAWLRHAYIMPEYREQRLYCELLDLRMNEANQVEAKSIRTIANPSTAETFERRGFSLVSERGKYKVYEKEL